MEGMEISVYQPKEEFKNINSLGERVFVLGPLSYGMDIQARDKKVRISYNIDPEQIDQEHYEEISPDVIPANIYAIFLQKVNTDLAKIDRMYENLSKNRTFVASFVPFISSYAENGAEPQGELAEVSEYTEEDAMADAIRAAKQSRDEQQEQERLANMKSNRANMIKRALHKRKK